MADKPAPADATEAKEAEPLTREGVVEALGLEGDRAEAALSLLGELVAQEKSVLSREKLKLAMSNRQLGKKAKSAEQLAAELETLRAQIADSEEKGQAKAADEEAKSLAQQLKAMKIQFGTEAARLKKELEEARAKEAASASKVAELARKSEFEQAVKALKNVRKNAEPDMLNAVEKVFRTGPDGTSYAPDPADPSGETPLLNSETGEVLDIAGYLEQRQAAGDTAWFEESTPANFRRIGGGTGGQQADSHGLIKNGLAGLGIN